MLITRFKTYSELSPFATTIASTISDFLMSANSTSCTLLNDDARLGVKRFLFPLIGETLLVGELCFFEP